MPRKSLIALGHLPTHPSFTPYALAIGQAAIAWNNLHEALRVLFWSALGHPDSPSVNAMWHSLRSDRLQRGLVEAVVQNSHDVGELSDDAYERLQWLFRKADNLSNARDDAVHTPFISSRTEGPTVFYSAFRGHPRAKRLMTKHILTEIRWCRDAAVILTDFCYRLDEWLVNPENNALPDIPQLPNRGQKNNRPNRPRRRQKTKPPPPPRQSSQG